MTCAVCAAITALQGDHVALLVVVSKALTPDAQADQMNVLTHVLRRQVGLQPAEYRYLRLPQQDKIRDCCREAAAKKLAAINPQVVLPCGNEAVELVLGRRGITQLRGQAQALAGLDCWVLPTLSPAVVLHDPSKYRVFEDDVKAAAALRSTPFTRSADEQAREITFDVITTVGEAEALAQKVRELGKATLDVETGGGKDVNAYSGGYLIAVGFGLSPDHSAIIGRDLLQEPAIRDILAALFQAENVTWILHNGKYDIQYLRAYIGPTPGTFLQVDDTLLMRYALQGKPGDLGLKDLSNHYLGAPDYERGMRETYVCVREPAHDPHGKPYGKEDYARIPDEMLHKYLSYDCAYTYQLADYFWPKVVAEGYEDLYRSLLIPIHHVLTEVEAVGIGVDLEYTAGKRREYRGIVTNLEERILRQAKALGWERPIELGKKGQPLKRPEGYYEFNPGSPLQVQQILYDIMGLVSPDRKSPRGTDHKILEVLKKTSNHPFIEDLLEHRVYGKVLGTYLEGVPRGVDPHGRIHGRFNIAGTETGRLSSSSPNLQNIPRSSRDTGKDVKRMFVPAPGYVFLQADMSQAEYRVAAVLSGEPFLWKTYEAGEDLHSAMATALYGKNYTKEQRTRAKTVNFGSLYGMSEVGLADQLGISQIEASSILQEYWMKMPVLRAQLTAWSDEALSTGKVTTPFGRTRHWDFRSDTGAIRREASNHPIQSVASDLMLYGMIAVHAWLTDNPVGQIVANVHDSILLQVRPEHLADVARKVYKIMTTVPLDKLKTTLPFEADVEISDTSWGDLKEYPKELWA